MDTPELTPEAAAEAYANSILNHPTLWAARKESFLAGQSYASTLAENEIAALTAKLKETQDRSETYWSNLQVCREEKSYLQQSVIRIRSESEPLTARLKEVEGERDEMMKERNHAQEAMFRAQRYEKQADAENMAEREIANSLRSELTAAREELRASRQNCADFRRAAEKSSNALTAANKAREKAVEHAQKLSDKLARKGNQLKTQGERISNLLQGYAEALECDGNEADIIKGIIADRDRLKAELESARAEVATFCGEIAEKFGKPILQLGDVACLLGMQFGELDELRRKLEEAEKELARLNGPCDWDKKAWDEVNQTRRDLLESQAQGETMREEFTQIVEAVNNSPDSWSPGVWPWQPDSLSIPPSTALLEFSERVWKEGWNKRHEPENNTRASRSFCDSTWRHSETYLSLTRNSVT